MTFWATLSRALRLRCPKCGLAPIFRRWSFRMPSECAACQLSLQREPGFYLGAIYVNYGFTSLAILVTYLWMTIAIRATPTFKLTVCAVIAVFLPVLLFRHARSLWLAMDVFIDSSSRS